MVCLGLELGVAGWNAQMNPLSNGCRPRRLDDFGSSTLFNIHYNYSHSNYGSQIKVQKL